MLPLPRSYIIFAKPLPAMAQKLIQTQKTEQTQTLTPQQVLQVRLLEMPVSEFEQRVKNELIDNGALEESFSATENENNGEDSQQDTNDLLDNPYLNEDSIDPQARQVLDDYRTPDDVPDYLWQYREHSRQNERMDYGEHTSFFEQMKQQMSECDLTTHETQLMEYLIGSLENNGFLKKDLHTIADELEIYRNIQTTTEELSSVLTKLQTFDPPGIGARNLQECLILQLQRSDEADTHTKQTEIKIVTQMFRELTTNRWDKIADRLHMTQAEVAHLRANIARLNPSPGSAMGEIAGHNFQQIIPDFVVDVDDNGTISLTFNRGEVPELNISPSFMQFLSQPENQQKNMSKSRRNALTYTRQKIEKAQFFIQAVKLRRHTLTSVMQAIIDIQRPFFLEGDETLLRPMILKDVALHTGLDISTVSRAASGKYVETPYGIFPLKWFFTEGYTTTDGKELSTRSILATIKTLIDQENKTSPLTDEILAAELNRRGMPVARRTVAKYREQLGIPVARLRK